VTPTVTKRALHLGVRFYRVDTVEVVLIPLLDEVSDFTRMAGDGYFLVVLSGLPGTAYPLNLRAPASFDPDYLKAKFHLRGGGGYAPRELAGALALIAKDLAREEGLDS
jgi:hypothetical protein